MLPLEKVTIFGNGVVHLDFSGKLTSQKPLSFSTTAEEIEMIISSFSTHCEAGSIPWEASTSNSLRLNDEEDSDLFRNVNNIVSLLNALKGCKIQWKTFSFSGEGLLLFCEEEGGDKTARKDVLITVLDEEGAIHTFYSKELLSFSILEQSVNNQLFAKHRQYITETCGGDVQLAINLDVSADQHIHMSYSLKGIPWSLFYKAYLQQDNKATIQAFGRISNSSHIDWDNVNIDLTTKTFFAGFDKDKHSSGLTGESPKHYSLSLPKKVTIFKNSSLVTQLFSLELTTKEVCIFHTTIHPTSTIKSMRITNSYNHALESGAISFFQKGYPVGHSHMPHLNINETTYIPVALENTILVSKRETSLPTVLKHLLFVRESIEETLDEKINTEYKIENVSDQEKDVLIIHNNTPEYKLEKTLIPNEMRDDITSYNVTLNPFEIKTINVVEKRTTKNITDLFSISTDDIRAYVKTNLLSDSQIKTLQEIVRIKNKINTYEKKIQHLNNDINGAKEEITRITKVISGLGNTENEKKLKEVSLENLSASEQILKKHIKSKDLELKKVIDAKEELSSLSSKLTHITHLDIL